MKLYFLVQNGFGGTDMTLNTDLAVITDSIDAHRVSWKPLINEQGLDRFGASPRERFGLIFKASVPRYPEFFEVAFGAEPRAQLLGECSDELLTTVGSRGDRALFEKKLDGELDPRRTRGARGARG